MLQLYTWLVKYLHIIRYLKKLYLSNRCLTQPAGHASGCQGLTNFINLLKGIPYLILFGTSCQIFGPRYFTDCKPEWTVFMFSLLNWLQGDLTTRYPSRYTHDILSWPESWFCMLMKYSFRKIWLKPCNESFRQAHGFWIFLKRTSWVIVRNGFWRSTSF